VHSLPQTPQAVEPLCEHGFIGACAVCDGCGQVPDDEDDRSQARAPRAALQPGQVYTVGFDGELVLVDDAARGRLARAVCRRAAYLDEVEGCTEKAAEAVALTKIAVGFVLCLAAGIWLWRVADTLGLLQ
jgi:hypothetical protein